MRDNFDDNEKEKNEKRGQQKKKEKLDSLGDNE